MDANELKQQKTVFFDTAFLLSVVRPVCRFERLKVLRLPGSGTSLQKLRAADERRELRQGGMFSALPLHFLGSASAVGDGIEGIKLPLARHQLVKGSPL